MMGDDKIIRFPSGNRPAAAARAHPGTAPDSSGESAPPGAPTSIDSAALSADQRKALGIILSGLPFVLVGIKATPSGADFFTAIDGDVSDLRNARSALDGVIERAFARKGL